MSHSDEADIHGTEPLPRVLSVYRPHELTKTVTIVLSFEPTDAQVDSLHEHIRSWSP